MLTEVSMIHCRSGRFTIAVPFNHGLNKSEFGFPCGFGRDSHSIADGSGTLNNPDFFVPLKLFAVLLISRLDCVMSVVAVRFELMNGTQLPSSCLVDCSPSPNPTIEMWTLAPSRIQLASLNAKNMSLVDLIFLRTSRFTPPRID